VNKVLSFKSWFFEEDQSGKIPANLTPQQSAALADTLAKQIKAELPKVRQGQKLNAAGLKGATMKAAYTDPKLKAMDPKAVESGVSQVLGKIAGLKP
jgi:hypothetical protein